MIRPHRTLLTFTLLAASAAATLAAGCSRDAGRSLLRPLARPVPLSGRIDFGTGSYPRALVLAARVGNPGYVSENTVIRMVGTLTNPQWDISLSPRLTQLAPGVWVDTLRVPSGALQWKFVTNDNWEMPYDYASADGSQPDGLENDLGYSTSGSAPVLNATIPGALADGPVVVMVDESGDVPRYRIAPIGAGPAAWTSTVDGRFAFPELEPGLYVLEIRAPGLPAVRREVVLGETGTDVGVISLGASGGAIGGTIAWDPSTFPDLASPPYPPTTVTLFSGPTQVAQVTTGRASNTFDFPALGPGTYRVVADAHLFAATTRDTIEVGSAPRSVTLTLPFEFLELTSQMNLVGDFNGWPAPPFPSESEMSQSALGVWGIDLAITAATHNFKFVTDGSYDNPTDFGGDESVTLSVPLTASETRLASGTGTAIRAVFPAGTHRFTLDERRMVFTIQPVPVTQRRASR